MNYRVLMHLSNNEIMKNDTNGQSYWGGGGSCNFNGMGGGYIF